MTAVIMFENPLRKQFGRKRTQRTSWSSPCFYSLSERYGIHPWFQYYLDHYVSGKLVSVCNVINHTSIFSLFKFLRCNIDNILKFFFVCVDVMYSGEYVCDVTLSVHPHRASWKVSLAMMGIEPATFGIPVQCSANWAMWSSRFELMIFRNWV